MRLFHFFGCFVILGLFATGVYSQTQIDPKVIINDPLPAPACGSGSEPTCYDGTPPLMVVFKSPLTLSFMYDGTSNLDELFLEFTNVPSGTFFQCQSDIWANCGFVSTSDSMAVEFKYFGDLSNPGVATSCNMNNGVTSTCPNFLAPDATFSLTVEPVLSDTPEPTSILLFGTGLCSIFFAARRRLIIRYQYEF